MPSWDWHSPDWTEGTFERDERRAREFDRLEDDRLRELELVDLLRERGGFPRVEEPPEAVDSAGLASGAGGFLSALPESDEKEAA